MGKSFAEQLGSLQRPPSSEELGEVRALYYKLSRLMSEVSKMSEAITESDREAVNDLLLSFQSNYDEAHKLLTSVTENGYSGGIHDTRLDEVERLIEEGSVLKERIITDLTERAGLNENFYKIGANPQDPIPLLEHNGVLNEPVPEVDSPNLTRDEDVLIPPEEEVGETPTEEEVAAVQDIPPTGEGYLVERGEQRDAELPQGAVVDGPSDQPEAQVEVSTEASGDNAAGQEVAAEEVIDGVGTLSVEQRMSPRLAQAGLEYRRWQDRSWDALPKGWFKEEGQLDGTRRKIGVALRLAGNSPEKTAQIFVETIDPWSEEVRDAGRKFLETGDKQTSREIDHLKRRMIDFIADSVAGKEPDFSVFARTPEKADILDETAPETVEAPAPEVEPLAADDVGDVTEASPEVSAQVEGVESERSQEVMQLQNSVATAQEEWETLVALLPASKFALERRRAEVQLSKANEILANEAYPEKQKLERVKSILASFNRMVDEVRGKVSELAPHGVDATLPQTEGVPPLEADTLGRIEPTLPSESGEASTAEDEPLPAAPRATAEVPRATNEAAEPIPEVAFETMDATETLADMEEAVKAAHEGWTQLEATLPPYAFQFERERVGIFLSAMDSILSNEDYAGEENVGKKISKLGNQLEHFERMVGRIRAEVTATDAAATEAVRVEENLRQEGIDPNAPTPERPNYTEERKAERKRMGAETREAKFKMEEYNKEYNEALKQFILNQKGLRSASALYKRFKGEEVTSELLDYLRKKADEQAEEYRTKFTQWLDDRQTDRVLDTKYISGSDEMKKREHSALVVNPDKKIQETSEKARAEKQETSVLYAAKERIMKFVPKSKLVRLGLSLAVASGIGASAGALAVGAVGGAVGGAAFAATRWAASVGVGMGAGAFMSRHEGKKVNATEANLESVLRGESSDDTLSIAEARKLVRHAHADVDKAKLRRTFKTVGSTIAASFVTRGLIGVADAVTDFSGRGAAVEAARATAQAEAPAAASSAPEAPASAASAAEVAEGINGFEAVRLPVLEIKDLVRADNAPLPYKLNVENIILVAGNKDHLPTDAPEDLYGIKAPVREVMILAIKDYVAGKVNITPDELEPLVFERLKAKFGDADWWQKADIKEVHIGGIKQVMLPAEPIASAPTDPESALAASATASAPAPEGQAAMPNPSEVEAAGRPVRVPANLVHETAASTRPEAPTGTKYESSGDFRILSRHEKLVERQVGRLFPDAKSVRVITEIPEKAADGKTPLSHAVTIQITTTSGEVVTGRGLAPMSARLNTLDLIDKAFADIRGKMLPDESAPTPAPEAAASATEAAVDTASKPSAEAAAEVGGRPFKLELGKGLTLSGHNQAILDSAIKSNFPDAKSVQVSLRHNSLESFGSKEKTTVLDISILGADGRVVEAKGVSFGMVTDQGGIGELLRKAAEDMRTRSTVGTGGVPESSGAATTSAESLAANVQIEMTKGVTLSPHVTDIMKMKIAEYVPQGVKSVQVSVDRPTVNESGVSEPLTVVRLSVLTEDGKTLEAKGVGFGTVYDQGAIGRLAVKAADDLEGMKVDQKDLPLRPGTGKLPVGSVDSGEDSVERVGISDRTMAATEVRRPYAEAPLTPDAEVFPGYTFEAEDSFELSRQAKLHLANQLQRTYPGAKDIKVMTYVPDLSRDGRTPLSHDITIEFTDAKGERISADGFARVSEKVSTNDLIDRALKNARVVSVTAESTQSVGRPGAEAAAVEMPKVRQIPSAPTEHIPSGKYLESEAFQKYLAENGVSLRELKEQVLRTVEDFEEKTYTGWWDENKYRSPYATFKDRTLGDIQADRQSVWGDEAAQRKYAADNGFKYETLLKWANQLDYMMKDKSIPVNENTTVEDYVTRFVAKMALEHKYKVGSVPTEVVLERATPAPITEAEPTPVGRSGRVEANTEQAARPRGEVGKISDAKVGQRVEALRRSVEKTLGVYDGNTNSPYKVLSEMSLDEVREAMKKPAAFEKLITDHDLNRRSVRGWFAKIDQLTHGRPLPKGNMTFGEWIEKQMKAEIKKEAPQLKKVTVSWSPRKR